MTRTFATFNHETPSSWSPVPGCSPGKKGKYSRKTERTCWTNERHCHDILWIHTFPPDPKAYLPLKGPLDDLNANGKLVLARQQSVSLGSSARLKLKMSLRHTTPHCCHSHHSRTPVPCWKMPDASLWPRYLALVGKHHSQWLVTSVGGLDSGDRWR